jgi:hypothetical protein
LGRSPQFSKQIAKSVVAFFAANLPVTGFILRSFPLLILCGCIGVGLCKLGRSGFHENTSDPENHVYDFAV